MAAGGERLGALGWGPAMIEVGKHWTPGNLLTRRPSVMISQEQLKQPPVVGELLSGL